MKRVAMGLAAGCLWASAVWGAAFPFECTGGEAAVTVPADAAVGEDGAVTLAETPLSVSVPQNAGITSVTVTFEAEIPLGTAGATLAGVQVLQTTNGKAKTPWARAFVNGNGAFDVGYYDGGFKQTGTQQSAGTSAVPERAVYTVVYERGGRGLELYRGTERLAWDAKVTWSDSVVTAITLGGLDEAGTATLAGLKICRMKVALGSATAPAVTWPEGLEGVGSEVRAYLQGICGGSFWPGEPIRLPEVTHNGLALVGADAARALWFYGLAGAGGAPERGVSALEMDGAGGIALTVLGDRQANGALSLLGAETVDGAWTRLVSVAAPVEAGDTIAADGEQAGSCRFFRLRAEETQREPGPAAGTVPAGGSVTLPQMPTVAGDGALVTVAEFVFEGLAEDLGAAAEEPLTIEIAGPGAVLGGTYTLTANGAVHRAPAEAFGDEGTLRLVFEGVSPAEGQLCTLTGPAGRPGTVEVTACSWGGGIVGSTARVAVMLANDPRTDGLAAAGTTFSTYYRIPALATNGAGEVIAAYDARYGGKDLGNGHGLDIAASHSADGGSSWSGPVLAVDVPNSTDQNGATQPTTKLTDIGDACMLYDPGKKTYWLMGMTGGGLFAAGSGSANNDCVLYTRGPDAVWREWTGGPEGNRRSVKAMLLEGIGRTGAPGLGILDGPGHGIVTRVGREGMPAGTLVFPMQAFVNSGTGDAQCFAAYSTDNGATWRTTGLTPHGTNAQENCIAELDDGSWLMMAKGGTWGAGKGKRLFYRTTDFVNWEPLASIDGIIHVQGSCLRIGTGADGRSRYVMAHQTDPTSRRGLSLIFGRDVTADEGHDAAGSEGVAWATEAPYMIHAEDTGGMGYNSLCLTDEHTLGVLYESNGHIYFERIDISPWLR